MIGVLVSLGVVSVLVLGWMRGGLAGREQSRQAEQRLQADWLAESGLERAAARLAAKLDYSGEVWNIAAAELSGPDGARVEIRVSPVAGRAGSRRVTVAADFPADPFRRSRVTEEMVLEP
jgi:Tfp pilus assembly protein PilV